MLLPRQEWEPSALQWGWEEEIPSRLLCVSHGRQGHQAGRLHVLCVYLRGHSSHAGRTEFLACHVVTLTSAVSAFTGSA